WQVQGTVHPRWQYEVAGNVRWQVQGTVHPRWQYEVAGNVRWQYEVAAVGQSEHDTCPKRVIQGCQACVSSRLSCGDPRQ
ncbi:hypothetical protein Tco_0711912, partial [Tanacetum coccineum]